jgi:phosphopantetheine--protein transferase-like protein
MLVGIDVLDVVRMEKFIQNERFLDKYFTPYEMEYVNKYKPNRQTQSLAGLFAAKEALLKALGIGIGGGIDLNDIEVFHTETGKPEIRVLSGKANLMLKSMNVVEMGVSISHTDEVCTAICFVKNPD